MMGNRELLTETDEKVITVTVKEFSPLGVKLQFNGQGRVKGKYTGVHIETVDLLQKPDGTFEYEGRGVDTTQDGDVILLTWKGTGKQTGPTTGSYGGDMWFMTQSQKFGWLNSAKGRAEGTWNPQTNEASFKVYTIK